MVNVRATRKLLQRLGPPISYNEESAALLGDWYATYLPWRPRQVALLVNERTLLPLLMPLAPAGTFLDRFPDELSALLRAHRIAASVIAVEVAATRNAHLTTTANRSLLGSMNEFAFLAEAHRTQGEDTDLLELSLTLARTPCSPLYSRQVISPDREVCRAAGRADHLSPCATDPTDPLRAQPDAITTTRSPTDTQHNTPRGNLGCRVEREPGLQLHRG